MSTCPPALTPTSSNDRNTTRVNYQAYLARVIAICLAALLWTFPAEAAPDGAGDEIPLTVGRSVVLDHPDEITRISITDPGIVDAVPISTRARRRAFRR